VSSQAGSQYNFLQGIGQGVNAVAGSPVRLSVICDSGIADHVASPGVVPGARMEESEGSRRVENATPLPMVSRSGIWDK